MIIHKGGIMRKMTLLFIFLFAFASSAFALTTVDFSRDTINAGGRASYMTVWETDTSLGYANISYYNENTLIFGFPNPTLYVNFQDGNGTNKVWIQKQGLFSSDKVCSYEDVSGKYTCISENKIEKCVWSFLWSRFICTEFPELNVTNISTSVSCLSGQCITSWSNVSSTPFNYDLYFDQYLNTTNNVRFAQVNATTIRASSAFVGGQFIGSSVSIDNGAIALDSNQILSTNNYINLTRNASIEGDLIVENIIPANRELFDLGSTSMEWRSLYIGNGSNSRIYLGEDQEASIYSSKGLNLDAAITKISGGLEVTGKTTLSSQVTSNEIVPIAASSHDLGRTTNEWKNIYLAGAIYFGTAQDVVLSRTSASQLSLGVDGLKAGHLVPNSASTYNLGSTSEEWDQIYVDDNGGLNFGVAQDNYLRRSNATEIQVQKDFAVLNESKVYETTTGANAGTTICIGSRNELCRCGSCS